MQLSSLVSSKNRDFTSGICTFYSEAPSGRSPSLYISSQLLSLDHVTMNCVQSSTCHVAF